jgi:hypothetical protein
MKVVKEEASLELRCGLAVSCPPWVLLSLEVRLEASKERGGSD